MTDQQPNETPEDEGAHVQRLAEAIQQFVQTLHDEPVLVTGSIVCWESTVLHDDGRAARRVSYSCPTESTGMAQALGLTMTGRRQIERDLGLSDTDDEDDDD